MKICLINNLYKPFNRGGAEKVCETIVNGLSQAGHEVFVITTKPRGKLRITNYELRINYLNSLYYNLKKLPKFFKFFWQIWNMFNFVSYFKIRKILLAEKCDAVITNNLMGVGFLTPLAIRSLKINPHTKFGVGIKHLHIAHDIQLIHPSGLMYYGKEGIIDSYFAKIYSSVCRRLFSSLPAVIFPSLWLKDLYLKRNYFANSKINVLPNPVDVTPQQANNLKTVISSVSEKSLKDRNGSYKGFLPAVEMTIKIPFTFLFLGQIEKHKGVFLLIDAFNKIKEKYSEVELLIVGNGSQIESARQRAAGNNNIKFLGWPGDGAADKLIEECNCLVYPSLVYENCPNAIQRALTAGLPVLASDLGGIPELLSDGSGILFKPAEAADLAEKMKWMIENKNSLSNLTQAGRRKTATFKVENYVKELEEIIKL